MLASASMCLSASAFALQTLDVRPDESATARIATRESTRLRVDGARIADVFGSIRTPENPGGELLIEPDSATGDIYLRPADPTAAKPINLFVTTGRATYTLVLLPADVPSDTIVMRDATAAADPVQAVPARPGALTALKRVALQLLGAPARAGASAGDVVPANETVRLWREARFVLTGRLIRHPFYSGERYQLTNVSDQPMTLAPREFSLPGVLAVALDDVYLAPGATTTVAVIRAAVPKK